MLFMWHDYANITVGFHSFMKLFAIAISFTHFVSRRGYCLSVELAKLIYSFFNGHIDCKHKNSQYYFSTR